MKLFIQFILFATLSMFTANMVRQVLTKVKTEQSISENDEDSQEEDDSDDETKTEIEWYFELQHPSGDEVHTEPILAKSNHFYLLKNIPHPQLDNFQPPPEC